MASDEPPAALKEALREGPQMDPETAQFILKGVLERLPEGAEVTPKDRTPRKLNPAQQRGSQT